MQLENMAEKGAGSNDPVISNITGVLGQLFNRPKTEYVIASLVVVITLAVCLHRLGKKVKR